MEEKIKMKVGDTYPPIRRTITSEETNGELNFTDWTVEFLMCDSSWTVVINAEAAFEEPVDSSGGVQYDWADGDLSAEGHFYCEFKFTRNDGKVFRLPSGEDYLEVIVGRAIA